MRINFHIYFPKVLYKYKDQVLEIFAWIYWIWIYFYEDDYYFNEKLYIAFHAYDVMHFMSSSTEWIT